MDFIDISTNFFGQTN